MADAYDALQDLAQALAHRSRLRILEVLARDEACVCHLTAVLGEAQSHVSQHLRVLREAGLVVDRREGVMVYYRLADVRVAAIVALLKDLARQADPSLELPPVPTAPVAGCPCPHCAAARDRVGESCSQ